MSIANNNLFAKDGFFWWFGVVEDRQDPLKLGRCRVRIIGYHSDSTQILPTEDLPWAYPMQGITSAAISGKGDAPLGPLEGTWVIGFFADGKDCQQPIMMGTVGGIPQESNACETQNKAAAEATGVKKDANGNIVRDQNGNAIPNTSTPTLPSSTPSNAITKTLPPLNQQQIQSLMDYIGNAESSSVPGGKQNYGITNSSGFMGKYQMGAQVLQSRGYLTTPPPPRKAWTNAELSDPTIWSGKNGVNSQADFLANKNNVQETAMVENLNANYKWGLKNGLFTADSDPGRVAGILSVSHVELAAAIDIANGHDKSVGGTTSSYRYQLGAKAVNGDTSLPIATADMSSRGSSLNTPTADPAGAMNNPKMGHPDAYSDPNSVYPTCQYTNRQDTNKLATNNQEMTGTIQEKKEQSRVPNVETANKANGGGWEEPPSAYAAKYPYNKVKETESGHVIELDDTPNAERIHIYHKSGTFIEIDREGSVSMKVQGENYEIFNRNNRMYIKGNHDITIDGAKSLLVKNTLDVEIYGKTTVNIKDQADINVAKDVNLTVGGSINAKASKNISLEAGTDINITAGNYFNLKTGGDFNVIAGGSEQHRVGGDFDVDAIVVNLNSGTSNPYGAVASGLGADLPAALNIVKDGFSATGLTPLPIDIANPLNSISKSLSGALSSFVPNISALAGVTGQLGGITGLTTQFGGLTNIASMISGGGLGSILNSIGVGGLSNVLTGAGYPSLQSIMDNSGLGGINLQNALAIGGFSGLNQTIAGAGLPGINGLESVLKSQGINITGALGNISGGLQNEIMNSLTNSGLLDTTALSKGEALFAAFNKNGASLTDLKVPQLVNSIKVDPSEFETWVHFPDATQLSTHFTLGDVSSRVMDSSYQFGIMDQGNLTKYDIISNLKHLSVNLLDPIKTKYPNMVVSDAFRPTNKYMANLTENNPVKDMILQLNIDTSEDVNNHLNTLSPFQEGRAANLHFKGASHAEYFEIAQWMKHNLPYDQVRLEYSTFGAGEPFITVIHNPKGNRPVNAPDKAVTCLNGKVIANFLADLTSV